MKKQAYEETTIKATVKRLKHLQKNCHLADPESIKLFVANKKCSNAFKESLIETYHIYMKSIGQQWNKPFYTRYDKLPKIPTEERINMLISHAAPRMSLILSMSKDLGSRPVELTWLTARALRSRRRRYAEILSFSKLWAYPLRIKLHANQPFQDVEEKL